MPRPVSVRSGQVEFLKLNLEKREWRDAYQWLLALSWPEFAALIAAHLFLVASAIRFRPSALKRRFPERFAARAGTAFAIPLAAWNAAQRFFCAAEMRLRAAADRSRRLRGAAAPDAPGRPPIFFRMSAMACSISANRL